MRQLVLGHHTSPRLNFQRFLPQGPEGREGGSVQDDGRGRNTTEQREEVGSGGEEGKGSGGKGMGRGRGGGGGGGGEGG